MPKQCSNCRFWSRADEDPDNPATEEENPCVRHAPQPVLELEPKERRRLYIHRARWPWTQAYEYCGDWQPIPPEQKAQEELTDAK